MQPSLSFGLIGHSHIVALLDALGGWRDNTVGELASREGFSPEYALYHSAALPTEVSLKGRVVANRLLNVKAVLPRAHGAGLEYPVFVTPGKLKIMPTFQRLVDGLRECPTIVAIIRGEGTTNLKYINSLPPYRISEMGDRSSAAPANMQPIDRLDVLAEIGRQHESIFAGLTALNLMCPASRIICPAPPPPLYDPQSVVFHEGVGSLLDKHGAVPPDLRLALYQLEIEYLRTALRRTRVTVLGPPPKSLTPDGFLRLELANGLTHGNSQYGRLVWSQVLDHVEGKL